MTGIIYTKIEKQKKNDHSEFKGILANKVNQYTQKVHDFSNKSPAIITPQLFRERISLRGIPNDR